MRNFHLETHNDIKARLRNLELKIIERRNNISTIRQSNTACTFINSNQSGKSLDFGFYSKPQSRVSSKSRNISNTPKRISKSPMTLRTAPAIERIENDFFLSTVVNKKINYESKIVRDLRAENENLKALIKDSYLRHMNELQIRESDLQRTSENLTFLENVYSRRILEFNSSMETQKTEYEEKIRYLKKLLDEKDRHQSEFFSVETQTMDNYKQIPITNEEEEISKKIILDSENEMGNEIIEEIYQENELNDEKIVNSEQFILINQNLKIESERKIAMKPMQKLSYIQSSNEFNSKKSNIKNSIYKEKIVKLLYIYCPNEKLINELLDTMENSHHFLVIQNECNDEYDSKIDYFARRIQLEQIKNPKNFLIFLNQPTNSIETYDWISRTSKIDKLENILSVHCESDPTSISTVKDEIFGLFEGHADFHYLEESQSEEITSLFSSLFIEKVKIKSKKVVYFFGDECKALFASVICSEMKDFEQFAYSIIVNEIKESAIIIDFPTFFLEKIKVSKKHCKILLEYPSCLKEMEEFNNLKIQCNNINHDCFLVYFESNPQKESFYSEIPGVIKVRKSETIREVWKKFRRLGILE